MEHKEIEVRFLEVNKKEIIEKLQRIGASDHGEVMLSEIIFYDKNLEWRKMREFVKLRNRGEENFLVYKKRHSEKIDGTEEIEIKVSDFEKTKLIMEKCGLVVYRVQEKKRHTFSFENIIFDIDTWPRVPTYLEIESENESSVKRGADLLGLSWENAIEEPPAAVIENKYNIPIKSMHYFTFTKFE